LTPFSSTCLDIHLKVKKRVQIEQHTISANWAENQVSLQQLVKDLEQKCKKCKPVSAITCVSDCKTWRLKNQIRKLNERIQRPDFMERLLNTLKNERRLQLLSMISKQHHSLTQLQIELRSQGHSHSQQTILEEYIAPMIEVGLVQENQNPYTLTLLGSKINELVKDFHELEHALPAHSECYEEKVLDVLLEGSKTSEEIRNVIPTKSAPRVLSRMQKAEILQAPKEKDYIFFFRTKRDPRLSKLSSTENKVHNIIPEQGISAKKLADRTDISLRRTYKYLRKLKGKKLVFTRKRPLSYSLTDRGVKLAEMLKALRRLSAEIQTVAKQFLQGEEGDISEELMTDSLAKNSKVATLSKMRSN
jgi:predicted transcriptional regulator